MLLFALGGEAGAAPALPAQEPLTLERAESLAARRNPDLILARLRIDSAVGEHRIARAVPNPILSAAPGSPYQYNATLTFDFGPEHVYRTRAGSEGEAAARDDAGDAMRQVLFAVRRGYYDVLLAASLEAVARNQREIVLQLLVADSVRVRSGDAPERNLVRSELELARVEAALTEAATAARAARLFLQELLGIGRPDPDLPVAGELTYRPVHVATDSLLGWAAANRADVKAAERRVAQSQSLRSLARSQIIPRPQLTLAWQPSGPFDPPTGWSLGGSTSRFALGLGLELPLFHQYGGDRQRAAAGFDAAAEEAARTRRELTADVLMALDRFRAAQDRVARYEGGLAERAVTAVEQARFAYQAGATSLLDLLDAIRTQGETQADYRRALHDYWVGVWGLNAVVGKDLIR